MSYLLFMDDDNVAKPAEIATFAVAARHSGADLLTCLMDSFEGPEAPRPQIWQHPFRQRGFASLVAPK